MLKKSIGLYPQTEWKLSRVCCL
ncbi:hypothetical protein OIU79_013986 [Salix purpurea]|uniref:Uncharacterized protein n=1 Tax=Salix purpurea TaxID=77065 RepID=A0A9Q0PPK3_SALPP|nr:hypothetical protein OIU79_013986 [Salix purpurea]